MFDSSVETLHFPLDHAFLEHMLGGALVFVNVEFNVVFGDRDVHSDFSGVEVAVLKRLNNDYLFNKAARLVDFGQDFEGDHEVVGDAVRSQLELPVRGDEGDSAVPVEIAEFDALVELEILQVDLVALARGLGEFVVESKLALGHAAQLAVELELADDFLLEHYAVGVDQRGELLHHVDLDFVLLLLDVLVAPRDCASGLRKGLLHEVGVDVLE